MCDPIGAITLAGTVVATCYSYGCAVAEAPKEAQSLKDETSGLAGLLAGVQALSNSRNTATMNLPQVIDDCQRTLQKVLDRLKEHDPDREPKGLLRRKARVLWPLHKDTTMALIADIERQKNALGIALGASAVKGIDSQAFLLRDVQNSIDELSDQVSAAQAAQERAAIMAWLSTYDYTEHHQQACQTYCQTTCHWILSEPIFKGWLGSRPSSLWLSGPAGSGKTVLTSFVIRYLQTHSSPTDTIAYFYCNANTTQSLTTETVLASLLSQLCGHEVPSSIQELSRQAREINGASRPPTVDQLKSALADVMRSHGNPTVVVDGIDEASDRDALCRILYSLTSLPGSWLRLFLSSRPDFEIDTALADVPRLCASKKVLTQDIKTYVDHRLTADRRLARLSESTRSHICRVLVNKSEGMFRWAQCQLDVTSRMRSESAIDAALSSLPRSLQETYQRALSKVSEDDKIYLRRTMLWLTWSLEPLELTTLVDAIVLEPGMTRFDTRARLSNPEELLEICGTFAVLRENSRYKDKIQHISLAHHSVRDFFCEGLNQDSEFWLPPKASHRELAILCLEYLLLSDWTELAVSDEKRAIREIRQNHLLQYAACSWPKHVVQSESELELLPLISRLMGPDPSTAFLFWMQVIVNCSSRKFHSNHRPQPLYYAASYGLKETVKFLISQRADVNARAGGFGSTALHAACYRRHPEILRILLDAGCNPRILDNHCQSAIELAVWGQDPGVARVLLEKSDSSIFSDEHGSAAQYKADLVRIAGGNKVGIRDAFQAHRNRIQHLPIQDAHVPDADLGGRALYPSQTPSSSPRQPASSSSITSEVRVRRLSPAEVPDFASARGEADG